MAQQRKPLPEYENPPVSEVALSVEFLPLENWRSPHAGIFWGRVNKEYPHTEVHPPIPSQIEKFGEGFWHRQIQIEFTFNPEISRVWLLTEPKTKVIQLQRDRFVINWRKVRGDETYPRYEKEMRPRLEKEWTLFKEFVAEQRLGTIDIQQCEASYVNDIVKGDGWDMFAESLGLLSHRLERGGDGFLPPPENLSLSASYSMPEERGRLHFAAQRVRRQIDQREAFQVRLVARGKPVSSADSDVFAWFDHGREWIVRGFTDVTSSKAHSLWKRKN